MVINAESPFPTKNPLAKPKWLLDVIGVNYFFHPQPNPDCLVKKYPCLPPQIAQREE